MNNRNRIIGAIAALSVVMVAPVTAAAEATLTLPPDREAGIALDAHKASLFALLVEMTNRAGVVIKGQRHITDREISGRYEGDLPAVLEALLSHESYMMILGAKSDKGYTPVEKIIFTGQSERAPEKQVHPAVTPPPDESKAEKAQPQNPEGPTPEPMRIAPQVQKTDTSPPLPPVAPQIDARVLHAISRPPANTPEGERFDAAVEKVSKELEEALAPLKNLR